MAEYEHDHVVTLYSDTITEVAPYVEHGILLEREQDGIAVYLERISEDEAASLLGNVLDFLQGF